MIPVASAAFDETVGGSNKKKGGEGERERGREKEKEKENERGGTLRPLRTRREKM